MTKLLSVFSQDEDGAVTVDWVVLTAAMVLLGFLMLSILGGEAQAHADFVGDQMASVRAGRE